MENNEIRLNKFLSDSGVCSRREADRLIEAGRVKIDGKVAITGQKVTTSSVVLVDNKPIHQTDEKVYLLFNKPRGIVCTEEKREKNNIRLHGKYLPFPDGGEYSLQGVRGAGTERFFRIVRRDCRAQQRYD